MRKAWNTPGKSRFATWGLVQMEQISLQPWPRSMVTWWGGKALSAGSGGNRAAMPRWRPGWLRLTNRATDYGVGDAARLAVAGRRFSWKYARSAGRCLAVVTVRPGVPGARG